MKRLWVVACLAVVLLARDRKVRATLEKNITTTPCAKNACRSTRVRLSNHQDAAAGLDRASSWIRGGTQPTVQGDELLLRREFMETETHAKSTAGVDHTRFCLERLLAAH